jgi:protein PsiE
MSDARSDLSQMAAQFHRWMKGVADPVGILLVDGFHYLALFTIGATTVWSALATFVSMLRKGQAELSDILLLFIYLEVVAMVGIYFKTTKFPVRYLIYIAITALGRVLIEIGGAEHKTGTDLLIVTGAILVLSFAVLVLRFASRKDNQATEVE